MSKIIILVILAALLLSPLAALFYLETLPHPAPKAIQTENFTPIVKTDIIKMPPQEEIIIYPTEYQYISMDDQIFGLGKQSPNIFFKSENQTFSLKNFSGKKILLNFWASWCDVCKIELPIFQEFSLSNQDVQILLLNVDNSDCEPAREFLLEHDYNLSTIYDAKETSSKFYVNGIPRTVLVDENGIARNVKIGPFINLNELNFFVRGVR